MINREQIASTAAPNSKKPIANWIGKDIAV
jgi:hypothetical protein